MIRSCSTCKRNKRIFDDMLGPVPVCTLHQSLQVLANNADDIWELLGYTGTTFQWARVSPTGTCDHHEPTDL